MKRLVNIKEKKYPNSFDITPNLYSAEIIENEPENLLYYYHPNHIGSPTFVTNYEGKAVQHLQMMPFGEMSVNQRDNGSFDSRYKFTAKELDNQTGFTYFGKRYYDSELSIWLSVDPMAEKRSWVSPYVYCQNNPVGRVDPTGALDEESSTDVTKNKDGAYTVVNAHNDGDRNIYVVDANGKRTGEVVGTTLIPFDFMSTNGKTGGFHFDVSETGITFSMDKLRVSGTVQINEHTTSSIYSADASTLATWGTGMFLDELAKTSGSSYAGLKRLRDMSQNGGPLDFKVSLGLHPYTPISMGENSNMITTLRGMGNMIFGMNIAHTKPMLNWFGDRGYYSMVMKRVGAYNQHQNSGNGYNMGWPFYGEHTYSGTYIHLGYFGKMP